MYMKDWLDYLHDMLKANRLDVLEGKGGVSHKDMEAVVKKELGRYMKGLEGGEGLEK